MLSAPQSWLRSLCFQLSLVALEIWYPVMPVQYLGVSWAGQEICARSLRAVVHLCWEWNLPEKKKSWRKKSRTTPASVALKLRNPFTKWCPTVCPTVPQRNPIAVAAACCSWSRGCSKNDDNEEPVDFHFQYRQEKEQELNQQQFPRWWVPFCIRQPWDWEPTQFFLFYWGVFSLPPSWSSPVSRSWDRSCQHYYRANHVLYAKLL